MASFYDNDILRILKGADRPLLMREIVNQIAPNDYAAYGNIGNALTHLYRQGKISRSKPGRWFVYTYAERLPSTAIAPFTRLYEAARDLVGDDWVVARANDSEGMVYEITMADLKRLVKEGQDEQ